MLVRRITVSLFLTCCTLIMWTSMVNAETAKHRRNSETVSSSYNSDMAVGTITDGLVAYFPFENDAQDVSGNFNHGLINGNVKFVISAIGKGAKFNGINSQGGNQNPDYIRVPSSETLKFHNSLTVSYWIHIDGNQVQTAANCSGAVVYGIGGTILGKSGDRNGFVFGESENDSSFMINPYQRGVGLSSKSGELPSAYKAFRHIAYTIDGNTISQYVNGVLVNKGNGSVDFSSSNSRDMYIGTSYNRGGACLDYWFQFDGIIDEVRIYNRALSQSEIQQNLNTDKLKMKKQYRSNYKNIKTLDDHDIFIKTYTGKDPGKLIPKVKKMKASAELRAKREQAEAARREQDTSRNSYSRPGGYTSTGSTYPTCGSNDTCFEIIEQSWTEKNYSKYRIRCTKGPYTGSEKCLSKWHDSGKWASGCAVGDYHTYDSALRAGNYSCSP